MSSTLGTRVRFTLFGESHGPCIGGSIEGLPAKLTIPLCDIERAQARRKPGQRNTTTRTESDKIEWISGAHVEDDALVLHGGPCAFLIKNNDVRARDYNLSTPRPSHADLTCYFRDGQWLSGGGRFSGRLTAPLVVAAALCEPILKSRGISIGSHILRLGSLVGRSFVNDQSDPTASELNLLKSQQIPCRAPILARDIESQLNQLPGNSVGAEIELAAVGLPRGLGEPPFGGVESLVAQWLFAIPGVKSVGFGLSHEFASAYGTIANDEIGLMNGMPTPLTNRAGGLNGGLTNGRALIVRATMRPTPSIALPQRSVTLQNDEWRETTLVTAGRHDPCIALRGLVALEAALTLALVQFL